MPKGAAIPQNNRESAWKNIRLIELAYTIIFIVSISIALIARLPSLITWSLIALSFALGGWIWWRQYQVLEEFGKLNFLKSWMACGIVTSCNLALVVFWELKELYSRVYSLSEFNKRSSLTLFPDVSFWVIFMCMIAGLAAMGLTNLYLRRQTR